MTFAKWLETFLDEKGISGDDLVSAEGASGMNHIPVGCLVEAMTAAPAREQDGIKAMLVRIDFVAPGRKPVLDYLAHLGKAIAI